MTVGERIRLIRTNNNVSIRKLAELTGLSKSTLSEIENNVSKNPTIDTLDKIAKALSVSVVEFINSGNDSSPQSADNEKDTLINEDDPGEVNEQKERFLRSVARAKDRPAETLDKIADFIDFILEKEDKK